MEFLRSTAVGVAGGVLAGEGFGHGVGGDVGPVEGLKPLIPLLETFSRIDTLLFATSPFPFVQRHAYLTGLLQQFTFFDAAMIQHLSNWCIRNINASSQIVF